MKEHSFKAKPKRECRLHIFVFVLAVYFTLVLNFPLLLKACGYFREETVLAEIRIILMLACCICCMFISMFSLLSITLLEKLIFIFLTLISAILSYGYLYYGYIFDNSSPIMGAIEQANWKEISPFLTLSFFAYFVIFGIVPAYLIYKTNIIRPGFTKKIAILLVGVMIYPVFYGISELPLLLTYQPILRWTGLSAKPYFQIIPNNFFENVYSYYQPIFTNHLPYREIGLDAVSKSKTSNGKNNLLILVIGETARSMNFELNGYARDTNPYTRNQSLISFRHVTSCSTCTRVSVPCLFSYYNKNNFINILSDHQDNLLDILKRAKLNLVWLDNNGNGNCQGVCKNIPTLITTDPYDNSLISNLKNNIDLYRGRDTVVILHMQGSHSPYFIRYPDEFRTFTPDCQKYEIRFCKREALINAYDNSIVYTDYLLNEFIKILQQQTQFWNTALIYTSDHGESIGENGLYEHCAPNVMAPAEQTQVPLIFWASNSFIHAKSLSMRCIKNKENDESISHDNFFHSVLGLMDVSTSVYNRKLDLFKSCRA